MKRINPNTGNIFVFGDSNKNGLLFCNYKKVLNSDGFFQEQWLSPQAFENRKSYAKRFKKQFASEYHKTKRGYLTKFLGAAKYRAKQKSLPFNLDLEYLETIASDICPVFGATFDWSIGKKDTTQNKPSLDKIIPELGYVKGNVQFISGLANTMKQNATPEQLLKFSKWITQNYGTNPATRKDPYQIYY